MTTSFDRHVERRVFFGDLASDVDAHLIWELAVQFGHVAHLQWFNNASGTTGTAHATSTESGGATADGGGSSAKDRYCFVEFTCAEDAAYCFECLHASNVRLFGRLLRVGRSSDAMGGRALTRGNQALVGLHDVGAKLFVSGIDREATEADLTRFFAKFGDLAAPVKVVRDRDGVSRGAAFVSFQTFEASDRAIAEMHQRVFRDKIVSVEYALVDEHAGAESERHGSEAERARAVLIAREAARHAQLLEQKRREREAEAAEVRATDVSWAASLNPYAR